MSIYGCFVGAILTGALYSPQAGHTIAQDQPGMTCWADLTTALAATPGLAAGWTCTLTDGVASNCTAPVVPAAPPTPPTSVAVVSTGTPSLSGAYSIDATAVVNITAITAGIAAGKGFPNGVSSLVYYDVTGNAHTFTSTTEWLAFAYAIEGYVDALQLIGDGSTTTPLPTTPMTIP